MSFLVKCRYVECRRAECRGAHRTCSVGRQVEELLRRRRRRRRAVDVAQDFRPELVVLKLLRQ
jgi:hypothetical protein